MKSAVEGDVVKLFHIGIRVDEIVKITPSESKEFPTKYTLRNGTDVLSTGDWQTNVKAVESILEPNRLELLAQSNITPVELVDLRVEVDGLRRDIASLKRSLAKSRKVPQ